jgi:glycerol-3-phosphate dehydrogenase
MKRNNMIKQLEAHGDDAWDVAIIGGGASGLGAALESASRGYKTILLEQADFAKGTSSRSTKLIHGGVRYLAQGDIALVYEALHERGLLMKNAPHLVSNQSFVIPNYDWWEMPYYTLGLKVYDLMAGKLGLGPSVSISREETIAAIPNVKTEGLRGGVIYQDGQFDDSRLAINLAQTAASHGATVVNYCSVVELVKNGDGVVRGVVAVDQESKKKYRINAKAVINATGVFVDKILQMDTPDSGKTIVPSQGVHLVLDRSFLSGDSAILIPKTDDGRVLFAVPWCGKVVLGTTDTLIEKPALEPKALKKEVKFILKTAGDYLTKKPKKKDVLSVFAGLRPLAAQNSDGKKTKEISRGHKIVVSLSSLITITGGKWTTYRRIGEDVIDQAMIVAGLSETISSTKFLPIHGFVEDFSSLEKYAHYGSDRQHLLSLIASNPKLGRKLHPSLPYTAAEVVWAVREEMARTIEDVLARRVRALFLDARASIQMAEAVAEIMASELLWSDDIKQDHLVKYEQLARNYILQ